MKTRLKLLCFFILHSSFCVSALAQGTAFTYQGWLNDGASPANGNYDLRFTIYDSGTNGTLIAGPLTNSATGVSNGLFTVTLNFGVTPFTGPDRWLDMAVRTNGGGAFAALSSRQKLAPAPYAITAGNLAAVIANNYTFGTNATVSGGYQNDAGNDDATVSGGEFNNVFGLGATIGGGRVNSAGNNFSTVSGGVDNNASGIDSSVGGGGQNTASGNYSTVSGGNNNQATNDYATVPGGRNNVAGGLYSFATGRQAQALHQGSFVWADSQNAVFASTTNDQFLVRAQGGVRLVTSGAGITLDSQPLLSAGSSLNANNLSSGTVPDARLSPNVALRAGGNTFTETQLFNGPIYLNTTNGFDQSAVGSFLIDAPYLPGGRFAVLENGNVGIADSNPSHALEVNGDSEFAGDATFDSTLTSYALEVSGSAEIVGKVTFDSTLTLPAATPTIYTGTNLLLRSDGSLFDFFAGQSAGNLGVSGAQNAGVGYGALKSLTSGTANTAIGMFALFHNADGNFNTAIGGDALEFNTSGGNNIAVGNLALSSNTNGNFNTAIGYAALYSSANGSQNIALGYQAGNNITTGGNNIDIGNSGASGDSGTIRIGSTNNQSLTYIAGIYNDPVPANTAVYINPDGRLGLLTSSARFKHNIRDMADASDALLSLRPVTFQYKPEIDPQDMPQFGLVAEEVAKVDPDLVVRDQQGHPYTVRYEAVNAMLLNEFLKEHKTVAAQNTKLQALSREVDAQNVENAKLKQRLDALEKIVLGQKSN